MAKPSMPPMFAMKVGTLITYNMNNLSQSELKNQPIRAQYAAHVCDESGHTHHLQHEQLQPIKILKSANRSAVCLPC
jgi:hypothetical protein